MLVEKIYILGALLKLPFFIHDKEMKNLAILYLTFHSFGLRPMPGNLMSESLLRAKKNSSWINIILTSIQEEIYF